MSLYLTSLIMTTSYISDNCYVCGRRFIDADPPGTAIKELHHIVPRAFGGLNGPLVALCDTCHSKVHRIAGLLPNDYSKLLLGLTAEQQQKLAYLAKVAYNAKHATNDDLNKLLPVSFKITKQEAQIVDHLKSVLNVKSRSDVYRIAVTRLYNSLTK